MGEYDQSYTHTYASDAYNFSKYIDEMILNYCNSDDTSIPEDEDLEELSEEEFESILHETTSITNI